MTATQPELTASGPNVEPQAPAGPRGVGTAVAFDWALGAQFLLDGACVALGVGPGSGVLSGRPGLRILAGIAVCAAAIPCALAGEAMRRGVRPMRSAQIGGNAVLLLGGVVSLPATVAQLRRNGLPGHVGGVVHESVLLFADAAIVWLLTRPRTRAWFATTTSTEARARHGGKWVAGVLLTAIASGAIIAFDGMW